VIKIDRVLEYWTRWKGLEVTPTTAPYFRANKSAYEERLKELQRLSDEVILDPNLLSCYKDSLSNQIFDSIIILGRPNKNEVQEIINYLTAYGAGVATGVIGKEVVDEVLNVNKNEKPE